MVKKVKARNKGVDTNADAAKSGKRKGKMAHLDGVLAASKQYVREASGDKRQTYYGAETVSKPKKRPKSMKAGSLE